MGAYCANCRAVHPITPVVAISCRRAERHSNKQQVCSC